MDDTLADPLAGRLLDGRYAVTARIAHGGMATVYRAMDTRLDREVALKVMHAELARDDDFVRRFIGEAKSVARLSHQNVVAVFDQGADGPFLYLAMEYVPGRTLKELLRDNGRLPPATALGIMTGVLDGLAAAHASGIVHRDIKPENVLLTADGRVKVADFGLARAHAAAGHTRTGLLIGTVAYVPPEQVTGDSTGPRGDVYSAGVMLFEMLTGRPPLPGRHAALDRLSARQLRHPRTLHAGPRLARGGRPASARGHQPGPAAPPRRCGRVLTRGPPGQRGPQRAERTHRSDRGRRPGPGRSALAGPGHARGHQRVVGPHRVDTGRTAPTTPARPPIGLPTTGSVRYQPVRRGPVRRGEHDDVGSHTLVVHREDGGRYLSDREPFLQRWLFSPRLLIVALVLVFGAGATYGGWWLTSGRYAQVPVVAGDSVTQATATLTIDGFTVKPDIRVHSNTVPKGTVIGTSPAGRTSKGAPIAILVSAGPFTSTVPTVANDKLAAAQAALQRVHLTYTTQNVGSDFPAGTVTGTNPPAGTSWPQTKTVTILVSAGPSIPGFTGQNVQAAMQWASQHGVTLSQQPDNNSQQPSGTVTSQQPAAGTVLQPGEAITVGVSTGPQLVNVPNPTGMSVEQATQQLQAAGFQVQVNRYGFLDKVFDFSPVGQAPRGSTITLDVGF